MSDAKRQAPEAAIQRAIVQRLRWHGFFVASIPNEGKRSVQAGRAMRATGMRRGLPDLLVAKEGRVCMLEVKAERGRVSEAQADAHADLERHGVFVAVVRSQDEAVAALREAGFKC